MSQLKTKKKGKKSKSSKKTLVGRLAIKLDDLFFSRPCKKSKKKKYLKRKAPPIPANECKIGTIRKGNDGYNWKVIESGKSRRWKKQR